MGPARYDGRALERVVRGHRVYHEVYAEKAIGVKGRPVVAVEVRIWAVADKDGPKAETTRAAAEAAALVGAAANGDDAPGDLEPFHSALYDSKQVAGADEVYVALALRLHGDGGEAERERDRRLTVLRRRLEALGVFAGRWREAPVRPADAPDPWQVQGAGGLLALAA
jgi:hypothetical protein